MLRAISVLTKPQQIVIGMLIVLLTLCYGVLVLLLTVRVLGQAPDGNFVTTDDTISLVQPTPPLSRSAIPSNPKILPSPTITSMALRPSETAQVQNPLQFLSDYLQNRTFPVVVDATPWTNSSVNRWQYSQDLGGVSIWDYFSSKSGEGYEEDWSSSRYGWLDDKGNWQTYRKERILNPQGIEVVNYVIVDRFGTGVVDQMVLTHYSVGARPGDSTPDLADWGYLARLGRLRIEVDDKVAYDVPVEDWFTGKALCISTNLARAFFWRYSDFGSNGSILPIPYQSHIKISVYDGVDKPKWFAITGVTLPRGTAIKPLAGCLDSMAQENLRLLSANVISPESYLDRLGSVIESKGLRTGIIGATSPSTPTSRLELTGQGTLRALEFQVPKNAEIAALVLQIKYGTSLVIQMPFMAFFSDQDRLVKHHSTPIGVVDDPKDPNAYLFYCNYPMPYQDGITIELTTSAQPVNIQIRYGRSTEVAKTQLRVVFDDFQSHPPLKSLGPDYIVRVPGDGKLVGVVLATRDHHFDPKAIPGPPPEVFPGTIVFPMGYMESNVTLHDGKGSTRIYSGLEDFAGGGYMFDSDQGPGAKNLPFAGLLAFSWKPKESGYFTLFRYFNDLSAFRFKNGLTLSFQHGTWKNNFTLRYGLTVFYYAEIH